MTFLNSAVQSEMPSFFSGQNNILDYTGWQMLRYASLLLSTWIIKYSESG